MTTSTATGAPIPAAAPATPSFGVTLRAKIAADILVDLGEWIAAAVTGLDPPAARVLAERVTGGRKGLSMLHRHLRTHPDALSSGDADCPTVFLRLVGSLLQQGYPVTALRCTGCARAGLTLNRRTADGRLCRTCADALHAQTCTHCGRVRTVHSRDDDGQPVCQPCYTADPRTGSYCTRCGALARISTRTSDGKLCRRCYQPPAQCCIHCGQMKPVNVRSDAGPICEGCTRRPPRRCDRCATISRIATRSDAHEALCADCLPARAHTACHLCRRFGPWRSNRHLDGKKICPQCLPAAFTTGQRDCALCGRTRRINTTWPLGPVCGTCYQNTRAHPDTCAHCGATRILVGRDILGAGLCPQCCDTPQHDHRCTRCDNTGFFATTALCLRCAAHDRVHALIATTDTDVEARIAVTVTDNTIAALAPFVAALQSSDSPQAILDWLRPGKPAATLLRHVATAGEPVTHELLDSYEQTLALHRLRQSLVHTGDLPERADYLERLVPWLETQLRDHPADQAHLLRTYVHWTLLRRARQRTQTRPFTPGAGNWLRTRVRATLAFLNWLDQQQLNLADVTQTNVEQWLITRPTDATYAAREFLHWARQHGLTGEVAIPKRPHHHSLAPITEDERWTQLRRCLHDTTLTTDVRAAGALVLLFGLPVSRITTLRHEDLRTRPRRHPLAATDPSPAPPAHRRRRPAARPTRTRHRRSPARPNHPLTPPLALPRRTTRPTRPSMPLHSAPHAPTRPSPTSTQRRARSARRRYPRRRPRPTTRPQHQHRHRLGQLRPTRLVHLHPRPHNCPRHPRSNTGRPPVERDPHDTP